MDQRLLQDITLCELFFSFLFLFIYQHFFYCRTTDTTHDDMVVDDVAHLDLQGASRMTGGILRGRAHGNYFNFADAQAEPVTQDSVMGKVHIYRTHVDPRTTQPYMSINHEVTGNLAPVLTNLVTRYSPAKSKYFDFMMFIELELCWRTKPKGLCL